MFSFLGKKTTQTLPTKEPLAERSYNVQMAAPRPEKKRLTQMQIDLGGETRKICNVCDMDYISSNGEDEALHKKFHAMSVGGVDLGKASVETLKKRKVWSGSDGGFIAVISRKDVLAIRNKATQVLEVVNTELGAVTIEDEKLWSQITQTGKPSKESDDTSTEIARRARSSSDRFKVYLYIRGQKCIGACLAERIQEAYMVMPPEDVPGDDTGPSEAPGSSSLAISQNSHSAILGISRIWTSKFSRMGGVATALLDSATSDFLYGMRVPKDVVAFSQPTDSGGRLARKWFGTPHGWHVYAQFS
jgi:N-acetyltransferase